MPAVCIWSQIMWARDESGGVSWCDITSGMRGMWKRADSRSQDTKPAGDMNRESSKNSLAYSLSRARNSISGSLRGPPISARFCFQVVETSVNHVDWDVN